MPVCLSMGEGLSMRDYSRPIYKTWDKKGIKPPENYSSWVEYGNAYTPPGESVVKPETRLGYPDGWQWYEE